MFQHRHNVQQTGPVQSLILLFFGSLLFWEWLKPLPLLTDTVTVTPFMLFFVFILFILALRLPGMVNFIVISFVMTYAIHYLYIGGTFFTKDWLLYLISDFVHSLGLLFGRELIGHSFFVRTFLFFILLWLMASYLFRSIVHRRNILFFFLCTITYLAILDTFSPFKMDQAMIRTVIIGFVMLTVLQMFRVFNQNRKSHVYRQSFPYAWLILSLTIIVTVSSIGYVAPKAEPSWPDPVHFIKSYSEAALAGEGVGVGKIQKVGYGDRDEVLGGSFIQDDRSVFIATTQVNTYWRGESKDIYTGRGWSSSEDNEQLFDTRDISQALTTFPLYTEQVESESITSSIQMRSRRYSTIFYPGQPTDVHVVPQSDIVKIDENAAKISFWESRGANPHLFMEYVVESKVPTFKIKDLRETSISNVPSDIQERYTQLPDTLPDRVRDLAIELTHNYTNQYEKTKQIENFFRRFGYEYAIEDIPVPGVDEDYVDQFIFETKRGYCNNFSSAMVVMLRSVDIPARWVKGFTFGEITSKENGVYTTTVRNRNAHSWVEVYFPGTGWVPFEPTKTFQNPYDFELDLSGASSTMNEVDRNLEQRLLDEFPQVPQLERDKDIPTTGGGSKKNTWFKKQYVIIGASVLLASIVLFTFLFRRKMLLSWVILRYRKHDDPALFLKAYEVFIRLAGRFVLVKKPSQTMREYVLALEPTFASREIRPLTNMFEELRYGHNKETGSKIKKAFQLWEAIMKKMRS